MSLSDINDRLMDGLGIISKEDAWVLNEAKALQAPLRKINFPASLNNEFHEYLLGKQREYRVKLQTLIETLGAGSKPIYYADLANQKFATELKKLGTTISHDTLQAVFVIRMYNLFVDYKGEPSYIATLKDYKLRAKKLTGYRTKGKDLFYEEVGFRKLSDQEITDDAFELTKDIFTHTYSQSDIEDFIYFFEIASNKRFDTNVFKKDSVIRSLRSERLAYEGNIPFKDRYNIMTRHKNLSNEKFRRNIEFIANIPSITDGKTAQMVNQFKLDRKLIENFMKEKEVIKLENKKTHSIAGRRLINFYRGKWMKDFIIPEL